MLGRIIDAFGQNVRVVSVQAGPHAVMEAYVIFLGSGYQQKLIEYPLFDLRRFKRCLQRCFKYFRNSESLLSDRVHCE